MERSPTTNALKVEEAIAARRRIGHRALDHDVSPRTQQEPQPEISSTEGFAINFPSIFATRTSDTGPLNGISEIEIAAEAAKQANASGAVFLSPEINGFSIVL